MSSHPTEFQGSVIDAVREAIEREVPNSRAEVNGGGHYTIEVTSPVFAGKNTLQSQRLVYSAIAHLMKGKKPAWNRRSSHSLPSVANTTTRNRWRALLSLNR